MKSKIIIILFFICIIGGAIFLLNRNEEQDISSQTLDNSINNGVNGDVTNTESENKMVSDLKVIVDGKTYHADIEENETAKAFVNMLPQDFNMSELNGNEKYIYLDTTLPTNSYSPKHIEAGDIMLFGNNCLVVFYESFDTSYSYTKIGHIKDFEELGNTDITIKFEK